MVSVDHWRDSFEAALEKIEQYRNDPDRDMRLITLWLMETEANPYGFIERGHARAFESAEGFAGLLHTIHHALVDDGEICFVAVNGRPMIVFANRDELGYVELRSEVEVAIAERRGIETTYDVIDGVAAFIDRQDRYEANAPLTSRLLISAGRRRSLSMSGVSRPRSWISNTNAASTLSPERNNQGLAIASPSSSSLNSEWSSSL
jgi:hypothetical protein